MRLANSIQGPLNGGFSRSGLVLPFLSLLGLSRFFRDFPGLSGDSSGIFLICPFPLSRPINGAYEEQSRKGLRHNLDLFRNKWKPHRFGTPRFSFSQSMHVIRRYSSELSRPRKKTQPAKNKSHSKIPHQLFNYSRGAKRDKLNGTKGAEFAVFFRRFSVIFADFRFSLDLQHFGGADLPRKPQETAEFCRNPFVPFIVCPF